MQEHGYSTTLTQKEIEKIIEKALVWAQGEKTKITNFLFQGKTFFSYTGMGIIPALIISNFLRVLTQKHYYIVNDATEIAVHIAPYREEDYGVIHFMTSSWERNETARLTDALYIMMVPALYIIPNAEDPVLQQKINPEDRIHVPEEKYSVLYESILAAVAGIEASQKISGRKDQRVKRLIEEISTLDQIIPDFYNYYKNEIRVLKEVGNKLTILYTPMMRAAALSIGYKLNKIGREISIYPLSIGLSFDLIGDNIIVIYTTVEEDLVKEARFRFMRKNISPLSIGFKTDPLSAQLYGVILSYFV